MAGSTAHSADLLAQAMVSEPTTLAQQLIVLPIVLSLLVGAITLMMRRKVTWHPFLVGSTFLILTGTNLMLLKTVLAEGPVTVTMGSWLPPFGITFTVDALGALFILTTSIIGFLVTIYASTDVDVNARRYGFYPFLILLCAGVSGAFMTGDIFNLYVWFEVLLIASFGLIVVGNERAQLDGAVKYAFLNLIATTLFLIAVAYLYGLTGTLNMADIARIMHADPQGMPLVTLTLLFILAFAMKAAAFPVNFWLPASYHTPANVVSAIFAGLLTKVGVYALLRVLVLLMPQGMTWHGDLILWFGAATAVLGAMGALAQTDMRRTLSYIVIAGIGAMLIGLGLQSEQALTGAIMYAVHSMLVMTGLFLAIGYAGRLMGTYDLRAMGGLYRRMPLLAAFSLILIFAASGLPPFSGFYPKLMLVQAGLVAGKGWIVGLYLLSSFITMIALGRVFVFGFWRNSDASDPDATHVNVLASEGVPERSLVIMPILAFVVISMGLGLFANPLVEIASTGAQGLMQPELYIDAVFGSANLEH